MSEVDVNESTPTEKRCTKCREVKPLGEFHRRSASSDGLASKCKPCAIAARRAYRKANPEKIRDQGRAWRAQNPGYSATAAKRWREANPDRVVENRRRWDSENVERRATAKRAWYEANRDFVLSYPTRHPERSAARFKKYRDANAAKLAEQARRRHARIKGSALGPVDVEALWTGLCGICGGGIDPSLRGRDPMSKSLDHITPISKGGAHSQENLQWTHLICNMRKGNRLPDAA